MCLVKMAISINHMLKMWVNRFENSGPDLILNIYISNNKTSLHYELDLLTMAKWDKMLNFFMHLSVR